MKNITNATRTLLLAMGLLLATTASQASRVLPFPMEVLQADGTTLTVTMHGDEQFHWMSLSDGTIVVNTGKGFYVAELGEDGTLTPTDQLAHEPALRNDTERQLILRQAPRRSAFLNAGTEQGAARARKIPIGNPSTPYFPHTGSPKALVILAEFVDLPFSVADPKASFDMFLNGDTQSDLGRGEHRNVSSVKKYFEAMSFGQFSPQFDVVGPVTLDKNMAYYGGTCPTNGNDEDLNALFKDVCDKADALVDFSKYDADGDGKVDLCYVIYAGYGQSNGAPANTLWPKSGTLSKDDLKYDGVQMKRVGINNELNLTEEYWTEQSEGAGREILPQINGIGLFCHEFSHTMGLPDMYPTEKAAQIDNQEMEFWDVMDGAEYLSYGYSPAPYTAWERETMGWLNIEPLAETQQGITLEPLDNGGKAYKIVNPDQSNGLEYMVLENVQQTGYGRGLLGHGLLVYHVNYSHASVNQDDYPNNTAGRPGMAIVPADGLLISGYRMQAGYYTKAEYQSSHAGDPFPGTSGITSLSDDSDLPNFKFFKTTTEKGGKVGRSLANIAEDTDAKTVSFDFIGDTPSGIVAPCTGEDTKARDIYSVDGRRMGSDATKLPKGVYVIGKKKVIVK